MWPLVLVTPAFHTLFCHLYWDPDTGYTSPLNVSSFIGHTGKKGRQLRRSGTGTALKIPGGLSSLDWHSAGSSVNGFHFPSYFTNSLHPLKSGKLAESSGEQKYMIWPTEQENESSMF